MSQKIIVNHVAKYKEIAFKVVGDTKRSGGISGSRDGAGVVN